MLKPRSIATTATFVGLMIGVFHDGTQLPMTTAIAVMGGCSLVCYVFLVRGAKATPA